MMQRKTQQRDAIRKVFEVAGRPLSHAEVLDAAKEHSPTLGIATVYRTVKSLLEEGWLQPVDVPGEAARYELKGLPHHHHFLCRKCGKVYDLKSCPGKIDMMAPKGFQVQAHELTLVGICPECNGFAAYPGIRSHGHSHSHSH